MSNQVVRVKRGAIAACMTCPLCDKLLKDATTISECLHTFCRKCIYNKLSDEELDCCPICNIDLGCVPLEKLRPDHSLQDVREKIFPSKRRKINPPEVVSSVALPARIKERSLSSLVVSTPRVSTQTAPTGRRSKVSARKSLRGSSFSIEKQIKKEEDSEEDPERSSSRETLTKYTQTIRQNSSIVEQSSHPPPEQTVSSPQKPSSSEVRPEVMASPTLWPELNVNFPFDLYNSFVRDTDDHRFGNRSIMDLIEDGMMYQARANGIFGRLRQKYKEAEAEEDIARRENAILKYALAKERSQHDITRFNNECLWKDLAQVKEKLETTKAVQRTTVDMKVDLIWKNEALLRQNEALVKSNQSLAIQINNAQISEERHLTLRQKMEAELQELKAQGPPLTEELRKQIQMEYRKSSELNNEIIQLYAEGYEIARSKGKAKLTAASVDPTLLDSSDDDDEDEACR